MKQEPVKRVRWWQTRVRLFGQEWTWGWAIGLWIFAALTVIYLIDVAKHGRIID